MDAAQLDRTIADLAGALGDSTRRGIYITVRQAPEPMTASQVAELFGIHPNVARHHLDRLATDGYLHTSRRRPSGKRGPGAGRPAKCYQATDKPIELQFPPRRYDLLAELLVQVVEKLDPKEAPHVAEDVGRRYGLALAAEIGLPEEAGFDAAVKAVATVMTGMGFGREADLSHRQLLTHHCPFGQTALDHPEVICSLDQGIMKGLFHALNTSARPTTTPHLVAEEDCVTEV